MTAIVMVNFFALRWRLSGLCSVASKPNIYKLAGMKGHVKMNSDRTYADYLDEKSIAEIQALEKETGKLLLAYYTPPVAANLTDQQLNKIKELEKKLCVRLVAYESHS